MKLSEAIKLRLVELMEENNMNGNQLALASGIYRSTIHKIINGQTKSIKIETITLICQGINITLKDFFDNEIFTDIEVED